MYISMCIYICALCNCHVSYWTSKFPLGWIKSLPTLLPIYPSIYLSIFRCAPSSFNLPSSQRGVGGHSVPGSRSHRMSTTLLLAQHPTNLGAPLAHGFRMFPEEIRQLHRRSAWNRVSCHFGSLGDIKTWCLPSPLSHNPTSTGSSPPTHSTVVQRLQCSPLSLILLSEIFNTMPYALGRSSFGKELSTLAQALQCRFHAFVLE